MSWRDAWTRAPLLPGSARSPFTCLVLVASALVANLSVGAAPARAASGDADLSAYVANGSVNTLVRAPDGSTYIGGEFSAVGPRIGSGMVLAESESGGGTSADGPGDPDPAFFPEVAGGQVRAVVPDGSGGWFIGGDFEFVGAQPHIGLAHILADGTVDPAWNVNADAGVGALALSPDGNTVYAGGQFTTVGGQARNRIAAITATGSVTAWDPNASGAVSALAVSANGLTVYAGGSFSGTGSIGGADRNRIAALDAASGAATAWDPNASGTVAALAVSAGFVYAGGEFATIGGAARNRIAALDAASGTATAWDPNASSTVSALALSADGLTVYAGGEFATIGGQARNRIAAITATGSVTAWNPNASGAVRALAVADAGETVYAGGDFSAIGGDGRDFVASIDASSGQATAWDPNADGPVNALVASGGIVYAGGDFSSVGGHATAHFAEIDGTRFGFSVSPISKAFGSVTVGGTSAPQTFTVSSTGIEDLEISDVSLTGPDAGQFVISNEGCTAAPIAPTATCTVEVAFQPTSTGPKVANVEFADNAGDSPQDVTLAGTGGPLTADASLTPSSHDFGSREVGAGLSAPQAFTLVNTGGENLVVSSVLLSGANANQFSIRADTCEGATIMPGNSCTVEISFAPHTPGAKLAQMQINDNAPSSAQAATLSGNATRSTALPAPPPLLPDTAISKGPKRTTAGRKAAFSFRSDGAGSIFECSLDGRSFVRCASPMKLKRLKPGKHVFRVRAVNAAGVADGSPATYRWKVKKKKKKKKTRR